DYRAAVNDASEAEASAVRTGDRWWRARALGELGRAEAALDRLEDAQRHLTATIETQEQVRRDTVSIDLRAGFASRNARYYEDIIGVLLRRHRKSPAGGFAALALEYCERGRARGLLDLLSESRAGIESGVD